MRRAKNRPDRVLSSRPLLSSGGVAAVLGIHRVTFFRRRKAGKLDLQGIKRVETREGNFYDMRAIFERFYPDADSNDIASMMYQFRMANGGLVR